MGSLFFTSIVACIMYLLYISIAYNKRQFYLQTLNYTFVIAALISIYKFNSKPTGITYIIFVLFFFILQNSFTVIQQNRRIDIKEYSIKILIMPFLYAVFLHFIEYHISIKVLSYIMTLIGIIIIITEAIIYCKKKQQLNSQHYTNLFDLYDTELGLRTKALLKEKKIDNISILYYNNELINAYLLPIQKKRTIVLTSKAIEILNSNEIIAIIYHELGHFQYGHRHINFLIKILFNVLYIILLYCILRFCLLNDIILFYGIIAIICISKTYFLIIKYVYNSFQRYEEFYADKFSCTNFSPLYLSEALGKVIKYKPLSAINKVIYNFNSEAPTLENRINKIRMRYRL